VSGQVPFLLTYVMQDSVGNWQAPEAFVEQFLKFSKTCSGRPPLHLKAAGESRQFFMYSADTASLMFWILDEPKFFDK